MREDLKRSLAGLDELRGKIAAARDFGESLLDTENDMRRRLLLAEMLQHIRNAQFTCQATMLGIQETARFERTTESFKRSLGEEPK
jgi:hypothetical protein